MSRIWITSDLHFGHDKDFLFAKRGFDCIEQHDRAVIDNWNSVVADDDEVYILGDLMLKDNEHGMECLSQLKGKKYFIIGNHDTDNRIPCYENVGLINLGYATMLKYKKYHLYLSHYPTLTANFDDKGSLKKCTCNLYGHTHQQNSVSEDRPIMYHVGLDSHNCFPVLLDDILDEMERNAQNYLRLNEKLNIL